MKRLYLFCTSKKAYGVAIIIKHLEKSLSAFDIKLESTEDFLNEFYDVPVIPYGINASIELRKHNIEPKIEILADAMSLGYRNKFFFYLSKLYFNHDWLYSLYGWIVWRYHEKQILKNNSLHVFFSQTDIDYSKRMVPQTKTCLLMNGVELPKKEKINKTKDMLYLGLLGSWDSPNRVFECNYFIDRIFPKFKKQSGVDCKLIIAGRGKYINLIKDHIGQEIIGEVNDLEEFFNMIDISVSPNPKGCGILNKVLDSFAHDTYVIGHPGSFTGLRHFDGLYGTFSNYRSFYNEINFFVNNKDIIAERVAEAKRIVVAKHNWDKIYSNFVSESILPIFV